MAVRTAESEENRGVLIGGRHGERETLGMTPALSVNMPRPRRLCMSGGGAGLLRKASGWYSRLSRAEQGARFHMHAA